MTKPQWRSMKTAPRDGTKFLAGQWSVHDDEPDFDYEVIWWSPSWGFGGGADVDNATHWMPLPSPPAKSDASK